MDAGNTYALPKLPYEYDALAPYMSEQQLTIHHQKHHQAYVNGANAIFEKLEKARKENAEADVKALLKELSFQIGGYVLHNLFWENLAPKAGGRPNGAIGKAMDAEFGSFDRFKAEFTRTATSVEGSGWAALALDPQTKRLLIMQVEKHNTNVYPGFRILLVLDMFEHAYYIDYKNDKAKYVDAFWNIVNWKAAASRLQGQP
jgi:Fe-Mn family superoxide dismutase